MTDYARFNLVVQDENGTVVDGASISVQNENTLVFPQLYSTRTGTTSLGNPFTASDGADAGFYVVGGAYKIVATLGAFSRTWRYVGIGTYSENDVGTIDEFADNVSFGPNASNQVGIFYTGTITGGTDSACLQLSPTFTAVTSGTVYGIASVPFMEAGSATVTSFINIRAEPIFVGAGITVTNAYSLFVDAQTVGGTLNRSIYVAGGISEFDGQLIARGTATNDNAATGDIGEFVSSVVLNASAVSLTTATAANVTSISLTAGDWDVTGEVWFKPNAATTSTFHAAWINTTSATMPTDSAVATALTTSQATYGAGLAPVLTTSTARLSLSGTTTVFLGAQSTFAVNTMAAHGVIRARRSR